MLPRVLEKTGTQSSCAGITRSDSEHSNVAGNGGTTTWAQSKGSKKSKGRNKREFKCCHECGKFGLGARSREASVFEASKRSLAEARCVDMVNVDLNALEIGAVLFLARSHKVQVGIDVFVHFRWFETKSCKSCMDLSARKVKGKLRGVPFWYAGLKMAETYEVLVALAAVSESDMNHDVFSFVTTKIPMRVRTTKDVGRNWNWNQTEFSNCQFWDRRSLYQQSNSWNRKDHNATSRIATNDERPRPFREMRGSAYSRHVGYSELAIAIVIRSISFSSESDEFKLELLFFSVVRAS